MLLIKYAINLLEIRPIVNITLVVIEGVRLELVICKFRETVQSLIGWNLNIKILKGYLIKQIRPKLRSPREVTHEAIIT